ncbi:6330_t:CDS:2, partial [Diversispora eburnea]
LENITVFISCLGKITKSNKKAGHNYAASLFYKYKGIQSVFYQYIDKDLFLITIYQNSQIVIEYKDISPNTIWNKTHILKSISGETLFVINYPITLNRINQIFLHQPSIFKYTLADWNNKTIIKQLYELHLKRTIRRSIQWYQVFQNWIQQKSNIIELYTHLDKVYDLNYEISERELRLWCAMFRILECTNITPYNNDISYDEFWTNATNSEKDRINGKIRMLSIIGEDFTYKKIIEKLEVSSNTINTARKFFRINEPRCPILEKPIITCSKMSEVKVKEFELFFTDKANVNMSSYKVDAKTQLPVLYLKNQKSILWEKFSATYPNGMK